jgi:hypothetical protein
MSFIKDTFDALTGKTAQKGAKEAGAAELALQQQGLDYLIESEAVPRQFREGALGNLGGLAGLEGGTGSQQDLIDRAQNSPLYAAQMGTWDNTEDMLMSNAAATGGLRSGNIQRNLADEYQRLQERSLLDSYSDEKATLTGLAGLPSNANAIGSQFNNLGATQGQSIAGAANARQEGLQGLIKTGMTVAGMF